MRQGPFRGIALAVLATACFTLNDTFLKLAMRDMPPFQSMALRSLVIVGIGLLLLRPIGYGESLRLMRDGRVQMRNLCELATAFCIVIGLRHAPIADLTALAQTAPILLLLGASLFLGEALRPLQLALMAAAFTGAVLVAQPGLAGFSPYALFGLLAAAMAAARDLIGRRMNPRIPAIVVIVGVGGIEVLAAGAAGLLTETWVRPPAAAWLLAGASGVCLMAAHGLIIGAFRQADVPTVAPFLYMSTVWALASGWLVFGTVPNGPGLLGMGFIVASGVCLLGAEKWFRTP
ncbi:DMT family transporter [Falsirhodobacter sp. 20TX0035]|uniref:DMT family transporter n=1 Tax=Falsirhodobacter sp. 20TX0035 TaxID=3022019 RepID=UPI0023304866|nr:DMT family transporter [Falsirhodobacter sp. 20TX0035]MDB6452610.1 DMT family transporter [Falsirhodobacter sp. 20TX0035]